jgi:hypothetical protein
MTGRNPAGHALAAPPGWIPGVPSVRTNPVSPSSANTDQEGCLKRDNVADRLAESAVPPYFGERPRQSTQPETTEERIYRNTTILDLFLLCVPASLWSKRRNKPAALSMLLRALPVRITSRWRGVHEDGSGVVFIGIASGPFQPRGSLSGGAHHRLLVSIKACRLEYGAHRAR